MVKNKLYIAIIGAGMIGKCHAHSLSKNSQAHLLWICDLNMELAESLAAEYNIAATQDYKKVLDDPNVDAVIISTPPWLHYRLTLDAIRAGKHVLCEKPFAILPEQADEMVCEAESRGVVLADCSARHVRLNPRYIHIHELISQKLLGDIYFIKYTSRWRRNRSGIEYHPDAKWFLDKSKAGGGVGMSMGIYDLAFIYGLFEDTLELEEVMAFGNRDVDNVDPGTPIYDIEEHMGAMLRFKGGLCVMWDLAKACHGASQSQVEIFGTRGGISVAPYNWNPMDMMLYDDGPEGPRNTKVELEGIDEYAAGDMSYIDDDFVNAVLDGKEPAMPGRSAARILKTIDAVYHKIGIR